MSRDALGLIETKGLVSAIVATDAAVKAAAVVVATAELTDATFVTVKVEGELGAVQSAVEAAVDAVEKIGELVAVTVIPRPDDGLDAMLPDRRFVSKYHPNDTRPALVFGRVESEVSSEPAKRRAKATDPSKQSESDRLDEMTVGQLRQFGRTVPNLALKGREISLANKQQLIEAIKAALNME